MLCFNAFRQSQNVRKQLAWYMCREWLNAAKLNRRHSECESEPTWIRWFCRIRSFSSAGRSILFQLLNQRLDAGCNSVGFGAHFMPQWQKTHPQQSSMCTIDPLKWSASGTIVFLWSMRCKRKKDNFKIFKTVRDKDWWVAHMIWCIARWRLWQVQKYRLGNVILWNDRWICGKILQSFTGCPAFDKQQNVCEDKKKQGN